MKKFLALLTGAILSTSMLVGCSASASSSVNSADADVSTIEGSEKSVVGSATTMFDGISTSLQDIKDKGTLVIGLDDTFAPMGFREIDGTLVGFDIDLATAVCERLGVEAVFQPIDWSAKELELSSGNIDCIWNGMSATPERAKAMSLSDAYLNNKIIVMTNPGITINSKEDLANYTIGVQSGSAALEALQSSDVCASIQANVTEYPTYDEVIMDMNASRLDCMVIDEVFGNYKNSQIDNKFGTADFDFGDDLYAIGFRKSDTELTQAVNDALKELGADGQAATISEKWFGTNITLTK